MTADHDDQGPMTNDSEQGTNLWEFWIDVGGTFTDCFALAPDGNLRRWKLLSSGVVKGAVGAGSSINEIVDAARIGDPPNFWRGGNFRLLRPQGNIQHESIIAEFDVLTRRVAAGETGAQCSARRTSVRTVDRRTMRRCWPFAICSGSNLAMRSRRPACIWAPRAAPMRSSLAEAPERPW